MPVLDDGEDHHVGRPISLDQLLFQGSVPEEPADRLPASLRDIHSARRLAAERRHQGEIVCKRDQGTVATDITAHECGVRLFRIVRLGR